MLIFYSKIYIYSILPKKHVQSVYKYFVYFFLGYSFWEKVYFLLQYHYRLYVEYSHIYK